MFITDRDLLLLEPNLFRDVGWAGQRLVQGLGTIVGTTLTLSGFDLDFEEAAVDAGHVVSVGITAYEVIERLSATTVTISRLRVHSSDPVQPPSPVADLATEVFTYSPQIALVHAQVLRLLGIDPDAVESPTENDITNPEALKRIEALGTLHLVFSAAGALGEPGSGLLARADMYRDRFAAERRRVAARIDLDGDGVPDATRRLNLVQLVRG